MKVIVLGGGMSGWMTTLWLKTKYPKYKITVLESKNIGTIGVGEGTTPHFISFLNKVGISVNHFISNVNSTTKIGINFKEWNNVRGSYYHDFNILGSNAIGLHFDSQEALAYISDYAKTKDITHIIGEVKNHDLSKYDFIFDCTGINRLILKQNWVDCKKYLPFNSALPFTLPPIGKNRTQSISTDIGWIWQIPLSNKTGCGLVYNNKLHTESEVKHSIQSLYPDAIFKKHSINFNPGYQKEVWVDNCIAVGLSSGFFEPIEATSLMTTYLMLERLPIELNNKHKALYNKSIKDLNEQVMLFIRYHYVTDKKDGVWGEINKLPLPIKLKEITNNNKINVFNNNKLSNILKLNTDDLIFRIEQYHLLSNNNFTPESKYLI